MRKYVIVAGAVFLIAGLTRLVTGETKAEYVGTGKCKPCHMLMHKEIVQGYEKVGHPKAMQKADAEGAIVADFESNPAFTKEQVAYVICKGRNEQAFLDEKFQVLPAVWDSKATKWKPKAAVDGASQCIGCHTTGFDAATKEYAEMGVGCEACHGPGSLHAEGDTKAIINPKNLDQKRQDMVCGQCHSVGKDPSGKFAHPVAFRPGDDLTKTFADGKPTSPGSNQQYSEHLTSKHAELGLGCVGCHDPHNVAGVHGQLEKPVNELCMACHVITIKDIKTHAPTAAEDATCATCHMPQGSHRFEKIEEIKTGT